MTLTPEQFNKIALKEDIEKLREEMATKRDIQKVLDVADEISKKFDDHAIEHTANIAEHDRFGKRITKVEEKVFLKSKS